MITFTSIMKEKLEREADIEFKKVDKLRHVSYLNGIEQVFARTLADCVWQTAHKLGEKK